MKKLILNLSAILFSTIGLAQVGDFPKNEVKFNMLNTIMIGSIEIGYERFLDYHQSIGLTVLINDTYNMSIGKQLEDFKTNSLQLSYNYNISNRQDGSGFFASPMIKYRFGEYRATSETPIIDMNSFIIGLGGSYKWCFNQKFVLEPFVNFGRNFNEEVTDEFSKIEFSAGFNIGFKF